MTMVALRVLWVAGWKTSFRAGAEGATVNEAGLVVKAVAVARAAAATQRNFMVD